jgi:hypothetical protein
MNPNTLKTLIDEDLDNQLEDTGNEIALLPTFVSRHRSEETEIDEEQIDENKHQPCQNFE